MANIIRMLGGTMDKLVLNFDKYDDPTSLVLQKSEPVQNFTTMPSVGTI